MMTRARKNSTNSMMTRARQNSTNSTWKPFATSTPLRVVPDKTKTDGPSQTQFTKGKDPKGVVPKKTLKTLNNGQHKQNSVPNGQIAKKFKRNRSTCYLYVSSSSSSEDDDSCLSSNGPTIKINLEASTNTKSNLKNGDLKKKIFSSSENTFNKSKKILVENGVNIKNADKRNTFMNDSVNKEISVKNKAIESGKHNDELISSPQNLNSEMKYSLRSKNSSYDLENKSRNNSLKKKKNISQEESNNSCKNSKVSKSGTGDLNGCESNSYMGSSFLDLVPTVAHGKSNQQQNVNLKSQENENIKSQDSFVLAKDVPCKRKRTKPMNDSDPEKNIEKKRVKNSKELTSVDECPTNKKKSKLKIKGFRKDSSHQLFSDSMHQELINSLDLTTHELDSDQEQIFTSPWKLTPQKTLPKRPRVKGNVVRNIYNNEMEKPKRSQRQRQQPKEFWMPRNQCDLLDKIIGVSQGKAENDELLKGSMKQNKTCHVALELENEPTKKDSNQGNLKRSLNIKNNSEKGDVSASQYPYIDDVQNEKGHVVKNAEEAKVECVKVTTKNINPTSKAQKLRGPQNIPNKSNDSKKIEKDGNQVQGDDNEENKADNVNVNSLAPNLSDVFKQLNQLPTSENYIDGVQTSECWSLKNFKCGVLTVKNQCQISNKTKFGNSYFGGIVIKGSLKMKIGSKDLDINQGDMAFVPPLTDWCVMGTQESESLFYYWCGRFKP